MPQIWKETFGTSIHSMAVQLALISMADWAELDAHEVLRAVDAMRANATTRAAIQVLSFTEVDKGVARGLEAADFLSWHWNKFYIDKRSGGRLGPPRRDYEAFVQSNPDVVEQMFVTGAHLDAFFELGQRYWIKKDASARVPATTGEASRPARHRAF
jgi:hypothetical protein